MNKQIKSKWLEALKSGKYSKTRGRLKDNGKFCCLGVLCDISKLGAWDENENFSRCGYVGRFPDKIKNQLLPRVVERWAGVSKGHAEQLSEINDDEENWDGVIDYINRRL